MKTKIFLLAAILSTGMVCTIQAQWSLTGNSLTSPGTNFIGTTDGQALVIKTDNVERLRVTDAGSVIFKSALGSTGTEKIFTIKGGLSSIGEVDLFEMSSSGSWRIGGASGANALVYNSVNALLSSGSGTDVDFTPSGQLLVNSVSATRLRGKNWWQTHVELDGPSIEYRAYGGTYVGAGQSAHKFTTYTPLTDNGSFLASFDNGGSSYMVITKGGNIGIGTASPSAKLHVSGGESWFSAEEGNIGITNTAGTQNIGTIGRNTGDASLQVQAHYANLNLAAGSSAGHINLVTYNSGKNITLMPTGGVGIGTTSPGAKLHVKGGESWFSAEERNILIYNTDNSQFIGGMGRNTANAALSVASVLSDLELTAGGSAGHIRLNTLNGNKDITLQPTRSVGINTASPNSDAKLDVNGNVFVSGKVAIANTAPGDYHLKVNGKSSLVGTVDVGSAFGDNTVALSVGSDAAYLLGMYTAGGSPRMKVDQNGSIDITGGIGNLSAAGTGYFMTRLGVGTSTPNTNAKLDVNGNIFTSGKIAIGTTDMTKISDYSLVVNGEALFTKARVKLYSNWPDYVFEDKYGLLPIAQLEQYIKTNKHLPGIPSAAEVAKEGIDLGGNQAQLLQKIEELTLYIIDQNKRMETLQKKVEKLEKNNP